MKKRLFTPILTLGLLSIITLLIWGMLPRTADAACGASTSSCKNCHEVQGQDSVAKKGDWHVQHSFGDFCQACHLGVATENDKDKAHAGLIKNPLTQSDQTCASCHPADTAARVAKYGGAANSGNGSSTSGSGEGSNTATSSEANATPSAAATQVPSTPSAAATQIPPNTDPNYDLIDFNKNLSGHFPWLSLVFIVIDIFAALVLLVMIWRWKKGVWVWSYFRRRDPNLLDLNSLSPELREVFHGLQECDIQTLVAIEELLQRGHQGQMLLQTMVKIPANVLAKLQTLSETEMELLFQVSRLMRENQGGVNHVN